MKVQTRMIIEQETDQTLMSWTARLLWCIEELWSYKSSWGHLIDFLKCMEDISVPRSFNVLTGRSKAAFQFPKYVVLLSINTIVQCLLKYEIPWLFHNLWRYRKIKSDWTSFFSSFFFCNCNFLHIYSRSKKHTLLRVYSFLVFIKCTQNILSASVHVHVQ